MGTRLTYNGVSIFNCLTKIFDESVIRDESGTDSEGHKFRIRVAGIVHDSTNLASPTGTSPVVPGQSEIEIQIALRRALLEERCELSMTIDGETTPLLNIKPERPDTGLGVSQYYDITNGPHPVSVSITHIAGTRFRVEFEIEASCVDCSSISNATGVLNNRWSVHDDIDENWYTTRTVSGLLRTKSAYVNPQAFRHLCIPPLQRGFQRKRIDCTTSPDGLTLRYTVVDQEVHASCPIPGTTWEATHTIEAAPNTNGAILLGNFQIRLTGPKGVDKASLIALAALISEKKLLLNADNKTRRLLDGKIICYEHENTIEMLTRVMFTKKDLDGGDAMRKFAFNTLGFGLALDEMPEPLAEYDSESSWVPPNYGTATTTGLFISYLQSPCSPLHGIQNNTDAPPDNDEDSGNSDSAHQPRITYRTGEIETDPEISANYSEEHLSAMYSHYRIDVRYERSGNKVALPIAAQPAVSSIFNAQSTCAVVRLASPTVRRIVKIAAERMDKMPALPKFDEVTTIGTLGLHLLDSIVEPKAPEIWADGKTKLYSIDAVYTFACSRPPVPGPEYQLGSLPWDNTTTDENYLPTDTEQEGIIQ